MAKPIVHASLVLRTVLFAIFQALFAVGFAAGGAEDAWEASIAWWPMSASFANLCNLWFLVWAVRREGITFKELIGGRRDTWRRDLRWLLVGLLVIGPLAVVPNMALGGLLFGDASVPATLMFRPLPVWAAIVAIPLFPISIGLTELPTYYAYGAPRLQEATGRRWFPLGLAACWHAVQHVALPLVLDWRFVTWRLLMFLPFALFVAWLIDRRRTVLPYMMTVHGLLDAQLPIFILLASLGAPVFGP
jgi:hypothetical protein